MWSNPASRADSKSPVWAKTSVPGLLDFAAIGALWWIDTSAVALAASPCWAWWLLDNGFVCFLLGGTLVSGCTLYIGDLVVAYVQRCDGEQPNHQGFWTAEAQN